MYVAEIWSCSTFDFGQLKSSLSHKKEVHFYNYLFIIDSCGYRINLIDIKAGRYVEKGSLSDPTFMAPSIGANERLFVVWIGFMFFTVCVCNCDNNMLKFKRSPSMISLKHESWGVQVGNINIKTKLIHLWLLKAYYNLRNSS
jgi:hypothetical protein